MNGTIPLIFLLIGMVPNMIPTPVLGTFRAARTINEEKFDVKFFEISLHVK